MFDVDPYPSAFRDKFSNILNKNALAILKWNERAKPLYIRISRFFWKGRRKLTLCSIDVFLNADSESPYMT